MERTMSVEEKIRRAEEIYARRRGIEVEEQTDKDKSFGIYKFLFRTLLLFNIIVTVLCIQNKNFVFKEEFLGVKKLLQELFFIKERESPNS